MNIPAIKKLVETVSVEELHSAEEAIIDGKSTSIDVEGADEGEKLTHVLAATWIIDKMDESGQDFMTTLRQYTSKVRESIDS